MQKKIGGNKKEHFSAQKLIHALNSCDNSKAPSLTQKTPKIYLGLLCLSNPPPQPHDTIVLP